MELNWQCSVKMNSDRLDIQHCIEWMQEKERKKKYEKKYTHSAYGYEQWMA